MKNDYIANKPWELAGAVKSNSKGTRRSLKMVILLLMTVAIIAGSFVVVYQKKHHMGLFKPAQQKPVKQVRIPLKIPANNQRIPSQ